MEQISMKRFPVNAKDYKLYEEVGEGVSATVYRALCIPLNEIVAIKVLDLEKCNNDLDGIRREVQTMSLIDHPNLLQAHCSFTADHNLWVVMPYMAGGSCLHIMKSAYPEGFEEPVIAIVLREVLKGLVYLHAHGHIHRDVKAGNILIDFDGSVKLADFGVSACMFDAGDRQRSRNTFVGTPCWMAPEVMQQLHGYDFKADIWSFGITALELAHGHAPFSKYPPMKVLLMTLQNAPPGLDYERDKRFSKSFKELVAACLVKDPKKRPTSEKLLKHHFFKHARTNEYLARAILDGLSPLGDRFRMLKGKEADFLVQNKAMYGDKEQLSQQEYMRGISAWNFNLEDLKNQAALIQDSDGISNTEEHDSSSKQNDRGDDVCFASERLSPERINHLNAAPTKEDELIELPNVEDSLASFPIRPLEALSYLDGYRLPTLQFMIWKLIKSYTNEWKTHGFSREDDISSSKLKDTVQSDFEQPCPGQLSRRTSDMEPGKLDNLERSCSLPKFVSSGERKNFLSGSLIPEDVLSPRKVNGDGDREYLQPKYQSERNYSGSLLYRQKRDANNHASASMHAVQDTSEGAIVQHKGRFKITSSDLSPKDAPTTCLVNQLPGGSTTHTPPAAVTASLLQSLQYILQQNTIQREQIVRLIKFVGQSSEVGDLGTSDLSQISLASAKEKELQAQVAYLQQSIGILVEELQRLKLQNAQLERHLSALLSKEDERTQREQRPVMISPTETCSQ